MGKPTHDGWKPTDPLPEPDPDHFTKDPFWMLKAKRVISKVRNRKGLLVFFAVCAAVGAVLYLIRGG